MKKVYLPLIVERDEDGYYILSCPFFKGCRTYGESIDEAMENIKEVIELCLEENKNESQDLQEINNFVGFREIEVTI